jgi:hypothetical protein
MNVCRAGNNCFRKCLNVLFSLLSRVSQTLSSISVILYFCCACRSCITSVSKTVQRYNALHPYSNGARFESLSRDQLSWLMFFVGSSCPFKQIPRWHIDGPRSLPSQSFPIHHSLLQSFYNSALYSLYTD